MSSTSRNIVLAVAVALSAGIAWFLHGAGSHPAPNDERADRTVVVAPSVAEKAIAPWQGDLLDLAFKAATSIPTDPHVKTRCRAQESVADAALELDQPRRALGYLDRIDDWRRGAGYADLAYHCVTHGGDAAAVQPCLDLAGRIADDLTRQEGFQDWQRDRIRGKIAKTWVALGQAQRAEQYVAGIVGSETGHVEGAKAAVVDDKTFDEEMKAVDAVVLGGDMDRVRNTLEACVTLYGRFYADSGRSSWIEEKVRAAGQKLPLLVRINLFSDLARAALDHSDQPKALALVNEAKAIADSAQWLPQDRVALSARLADLSWRAGDRASARRDVDVALALFDSEREKIVDIYRAGALRPLAEAHQSMGATASALKIYERVFEEGVKNPNSRPRAEDFIASCLSMILHGVEPDTNLRARMWQIVEGLGHPW